MLNLHTATPEALSEELWLDFRLISTEAEAAAARDRLLSAGLELTRCSLYDAVVDNRTEPYYPAGRALLIGCLDPEA